MTTELFLICALSLPATHHSRPEITPWQMVRSEVDRLKDFIHKNNPDAEIFIHPEPQEEKLREYGWEKVPFTWRGNKIWIKRKPNPDVKHLNAFAVSA